nr:hypothetical protein 7 [Piscirickettsiaceae bacterium]
MNNRTVLTPHGHVAMACGLVSLTDIWNNSGRHKLGLNPQQWCRAHDVKWHGDIDDIFVDAAIAVDYARAVDSNVMANIIQAELDVPKPEMVPANLPFSQAASDSSRAMLLSAFKSAGVYDSHEYAKLTDQIYRSVLGMTAYALQQRYACCARSVRKSLDNKSLLMVMTAEMNLTSYIYAEEIKGYINVKQKIQQLGPLVQSIFEPIKH